MTAFYFELNRLSYAYADGTKALSDITLHIPKGKKLPSLVIMALENQHCFSILMVFYNRQLGRLFLMATSFNIVEKL